MSSQKAISLLSSPHEFRSQSSERSALETHGQNDELHSTWNKVLESPLFHNRPLLPFQEWNINFSELAVGTRVGIGLITDQFGKSSLPFLLRGFFGEVFRGVWNGTDVAIKSPSTSKCNIVSGCMHNAPHLSMVTEYMEMGSLYYLIHPSGQKKKLSRMRRLKMLRDICRGLMCIHRMKIIHRTPEWMAPELIRNEPFIEKCDIFSLGVIMWELCTLNRPWDGVPPERVVYAVANESSRLVIPDSDGPFGRLIADCWAEPQKRPSCE
ncbi:hypothetical protein MLD38_009197 [Melastoma candidum]|uniref:Uncharacterized protein n=1 Tax=Melastoma candidum TaxID=119954 RepID=A0ACB9S5A9_9MYRT|nr:hypothetical protein MLD38_009197 [Melastoma candidum]